MTSTYVNTSVIGNKKIYSSQKKLDFDRISNVYDCDLRRTRMRGSESHAGWRRRGSACTEWWAVAGGSPLPAAARLCPARAPDLFQAPLSQFSNQHALQNDTVTRHSPSLHRVLHGPHTNSITFRSLYRLHF